MATARWDAFAPEPSASGHVDADSYVGEVGLSAAVNDTELFRTYIDGQLPTPTERLESQESIRGETEKSGANVMDVGFFDRVKLIYEKSPPACLLLLVLIGLGIWAHVSSLSTRQEKAEAVLVGTREDMINGFARQDVSLERIRGEMRDEVNGLALAMEQNNNAIVRRLDAIIQQGQR
ncbi:MAG: hypothetical protein WAS21_14995 [Geminicoccaceae bacterium]